MPDPAPIAAMIERAGLPARDRYDLPDSPHRFPDGAHWRHEASGISSPALLERLVVEAEKRGVWFHRVIYGMAGAADKHTSAELREVAQIARQARLELIIEPGVESKTDVGAHVQTESGRQHGVRVRGADQLRHQLTSVLRCIEAGIRGFLLRGECSLWLLDTLRRQGDIPSDVVFKVSYSTGHANPAGARLLTTLGADSFNPITDLTLPMLASLRQVTAIPMDLVIWAWPSLGSIRRPFEAPEMVRVAAPCYLKQELFEDPATEARNAEILGEIVQAAHPQLVLSGRGPDDLRLPPAP
jgi:hypothetical protein